MRKGLNSGTAGKPGGKRKKTNLNPCHLEKLVYSTQIMPTQLFFKHVMVSPKGVAILFFLALLRRPALRVPPWRNCNDHLFSALVLNPGNPR